MRDRFLFRCEDELDLSSSHTFFVFRLSHTSAVFLSLSPPFFLFPCPRAARPRFTLSFSRESSSSSSPPPPAGRPCLFESKRKKEKSKSEKSPPFSNSFPFLEQRHAHHHLRRRPLALEGRRPSALRLAVKPEPAVAKLELPVRRFFFFFFPVERERRKRRITTPPSFRPEGRARCLAALGLLSLFDEAGEHDVVSASAWRRKHETRGACAQRGRDQTRRQKLHVWAFVVVEKKKKPIFLTRFFPLFSPPFSPLLHPIPIQRWGPVVSEDALKRRQVVYLSERVSSVSFGS